MLNIKSANACYTGGGIYAYVAELENGNYFMAADDWEGGIEVNTRIDYFEDEIWNEDWINTHSVGDFIGIECIHNIIEWILTNKPIGNYCDSELEMRLERG